jgi:isoleucyl-tRNA synthetase
MRKEMGLEYTDRVRLTVLGSDRLRGIVEMHKDALAREVLAIEVSTTDVQRDLESRMVDLDGETIQIVIARV